MRVCPNCGNPLGGSPRYCAGCATQVSPEHEPTSEPLLQTSLASPLPARTPVPAWAFHDPPAPWAPGDPGWAARHPSWGPDESPWPASGPRRPPGTPPPWMSSDTPWAPGDAPGPSGGPPWPSSTHPAPGAGGGRRQAGTGQAGTGQAGTGQAGTGQAGTGQAGTGQAGTGQAAAVMAGYREASPPPALGRPRPRRWPRLSPGRGMTVTAMVTMVALLVTGGVAAWQASQMRSRLRATNTSLAMASTRAGRPAHRAVRPRPARPPPRLPAPPPRGHRPHAALCGSPRRRPSSHT